MVKKKRARTHTDIVAKAKKNFDYDLQDPIQRYDIKMVPLESTGILWIYKHFGLNFVCTYIFFYSSNWSNLWRISP